MFRCRFEALNYIKHLKIGFDIVGMDEREEFKVAVVGGFLLLSTYMMMQITEDMFLVLSLVGVGILAILLKFRH